MARQKNTKRSAARFGVCVDKAAGLFDDSIDRRQPEPGTLADFLGGEERFEDLLNNVRWNAGAGVADFNEHIVGSVHAFIGEFSAFLGRNVGRTQSELAAIGHGIARIDRKIYDDLFEL